MVRLPGGLHHGPLVALMLSVCEHLLPSDVLLLEGPKALLLVLSVLFHFYFLQLLVALMEHRLLLLLREALEVVRFHSVRSKH